MLCVWGLGVLSGLGAVVCFEAGGTECFGAGGTESFVSTSFVALIAYCHLNLPCALPQFCKWGNVVP